MESLGKASRDFQIFAKPAGARCNLGCRYCYYREKERLYPQTKRSRMADDLLEEYIAQQMAIAPGPEITFSWHGGEPTVLGLEYFRRIVELQGKHRPNGRRIINSIQTNGVLLTDDWCRFFAAENFAVGLSLDGPPALHDAYRVTKDQKATHGQAMRGYRLLRKNKVSVDLLCVVHARNVQYPLDVYRFFKEIAAQYLSFIPLVEPRPDSPDGVSERTVPPQAFGDFLSDLRRAEAAYRKSANHGKADGAIRAHQQLPGQTFFVPYEDGQGIPGVDAVAGVFGIRAGCAREGTAGEDDKECVPHMASCI